MLLHFNKTVSFNKIEDDPASSVSLSGKKELSKRIKHYESRTTSFWTQWKREYLVNLREFPAQRTLAKRESAAKVGDVDLVQENLPKSSWR